MLKLPKPKITKSTAQAVLFIIFYLRFLPPGVPLYAFGEPLRQKSMVLNNFSDLRFRDVKIAQTKNNKKHRSSGAFFIRFYLRFLPLGVPLYVFG